MSDPRRLLSEGTSDFERDLLRSWQSEQPSARAADAARMLAGIAPAVIAAAGVAGATAGHVGAAAGTSVAPKAAAVAGISLLKWVAVAAVSVAAVTSVTIGVRTSPPVAAPPVAVTAKGSVPTVPVAPVAPLAPAPVIVDRSPELEHAHDDPHAVAPRATTGPAAPPHVHASTALSEQVALVDRAREALAGGDPRAAVRRIDEYKARFPNGALAEEADVVRLDALSRYDRAAAAQAGSVFLAAHPDSPHASKVRALLGEATAP